MAEKWLNFDGPSTNIFYLHLGENLKFALLKATDLSANLLFVHVDGVEIRLRENTEIQVQGKSIRVGIIDHGTGALVKYELSDHSIDM